MVVLLGHTLKPQIFNYNNEIKEIDEKCFKQDVNEKLLNDITDLYIAKYGNPESIDTSNFKLFYVVNGNEVKAYSDTSRQSIEITWATEYFNIKYFRGLKSYASTYQLTGYTEYTHLAGPQRIIQVDYSKKEIQCYSYPYIEYELNNETIKKLKLDIKSL